LERHKLGPPIDLTKALGKARNRVYRVGIELEGGWKTLPKGARLLRDGSIIFSDAEVVAGDIRQVGELVSPPLAVVEKDAVSTLHFPTWLTASYPSSVNDSCGLHVHMSFKSAFTYQRLMTSQYPATILRYMSLWANKNLPLSHPIWPRLAGKNEYCQHTFYAEDQVTRADKDYDHHRVGNRYSVIVYPWSRHQTVECRLLPMMSGSLLAYQAIKEILDITNAFLLATAKREEVVKGEYCTDEAVLDETKRITV